MRTPNELTRLNATMALLLLAACGSGGGGGTADAAGADTGADADAQVGDATADGSGEDAAVDAPAPTHPGADTSVAAFDAAQVFFSGWDEGQNARNVRNTVTLPPADETFATITMNFELRCPGGACDPWDRLGSFGLVLDAGSETERYVEISRFITPYGVGATWSADVTDLRPLLTGEVTFEVFVDTWVGPGSGFGNGWEVDAWFDFVGGVPAHPVAGVVPIWSLARVAYGDPTRTVADQLPAETVTIPPGSTTLALRTFVTGHGQGNADNCAEFCPRQHTFTVGDFSDSASVWRDDCETTAAPNQRGTWQYPRAGWCPGAITHDRTLAAGAAPATTTVVVSYDVEPYENTCRPEADECAGCSLGNGCDWNDSTHTEPSYQVSALLIGYE